MINRNPQALGVSHPGARILGLAVILAAVLFVLGGVREARATHAGQFSLADDAVTVNEGDTIEFDLLIYNRFIGDNPPTVQLGFDVILGSAEEGDVAGDFCLPISGATGAGPTAVPVLVQTTADADTDDETLTIALSFGLGCANNQSGHAILSGQTNITVTINDTGGGSGGTPTFQFASASSTTPEQTSSVDIIVNRTGSTTDTETVDCVVSGGTADGGGVDFTFSPATKTLTFSPGETSEECTVTIVNNGDTENETIIFHLQNASSGAQVGTLDDHTLTILDSGIQSVQFSAPTYSVTENGGVASFTVTRSNPSGTVMVDCVSEETGAGEADEGVDFSATDETLTFTGSDTSEVCTVPITNDSAVEGNETFRVRLVNVSGGGAVLGGNDDAVVTITDDETAGTYAFSATNYDVSENGGTVTITVTRSTSAGTGSVQWDLTNGSATAGSDYTDASGTVTFTAGESSDTFTVTILQDLVVEGNHTINMALHTPVNGTLGEPDTATITILDDEGIPTITNVAPNTISTAGGASVVITGTNFTGATAVKFGVTNATSFVINSSTQITAVAPAKIAGTYDISVTNPAGTNLNSTADNITYQAVTTTSYTLTRTWTLIAWLGKDNITISNAFQGVDPGIDNPQTNNVLAFVTAVATWDAPNQRYLFWFPGGANVPGANDITTFKYGTAYWVAVTTTTGWTVIVGP